MGSNVVDAIKNDKGFTLIEVLVSMLIVTIGLLSLVGVMTVAVQRAAASSVSVIAREKAREAIESVHTARDTGALSWPSINNTNIAGGRFLVGEQDLRLPGPDGLVNTADDLSQPIEQLRLPGPDGNLNTADDHVTPLTNYKREVIISPLPGNGGVGVNPTLREITVHIKWTARGITRVYTLRTYVSAYS
jgi:type IV pilus modification protein PilV